MFSSLPERQLLQGSRADIDIDRMVAEAERFKAENEQQRSRIVARNKLENYAFLYSYLCLQFAECHSEIRDKLSGDDKETVNTEATKVLNWVD